MRDRVFDLLAELSEALVIAVGDEERVIAEALSAVFLGSDAPAHLALELIFSAAHRVVAFHGDQRDDRAEACTAVVLTVELTQEFRHVGLTVVVCAFGIAGRVHARRTAECLHLQSRVVGEAVEMIVVKDILCLLMGIFLKRVACLGDVLVAADVTERDNLEVRTEDFTYLAQLMLVVGSKNDFHTLLFCS